MNPATKGCRRLQKSVIDLGSICSRKYRTRQLLSSYKSSTLRAGGLHIVRRHYPSGTETAFRRASTMTSEPRFAEGVNPEELRSSLNELQGQGWGLDEDNIGIKKTFYFRSYFKAVSFVNAIASQSSTKKHHATVTIRFGSVDVHWTTHHPRGLTDNDISMAQFCEQAAELFGSVQEGQGLKCGPGA
ncbi:4a-hydroxytetrahydrobiopterin dehydratase [Aspergillus undulatus]|uniref:4a-hydroxytetrahydrobiopterin dehydratase n=1 Tax=Aspergillus undulatus TaxID=1810928 RepID=UPI003CCD5C25